MQQDFSQSIHIFLEVLGPGLIFMKFHRLLYTLFSLTFLPSKILSLVGTMRKISCSQTLACVFRYTYLLTAIYGNENTQLVMFPELTEAIAEACSLSTE